MYGESVSRGYVVSLFKCNAISSWILTIEATDSALGSQNANAVIRPDDVDTHSCTARLSACGPFARHPPEVKGTAARRSSISLLPIDAHATYSDWCWCYTAEVLDSFWFYAKDKRGSRATKSRSSRSILLHGLIMHVGGLPLFLWIMSRDTSSSWVCI